MRASVGRHFLPAFPSCHLGQEGSLAVRACVLGARPWREAFSRPRRLPHRVTRIARAYTDVRLCSSLFWPLSVRPRAEVLSKMVRFLVEPIPENSGPSVRAYSRVSLKSSQKCLSVCVCLCLSVCLSVYLFVRPSVRPSVKTKCVSARNKLNRPFVRLRALRWTMYLSVREHAPRMRVWRLIFSETRCHAGMFFH